MQIDERKKIITNLTQLLYTMCHMWSYDTIIISLGMQVHSFIQQWHKYYGVTSRFLNVFEAHSLWNRIYTWYVRSGQESEAGEVIGSWRELTAITF